jgi:hypothetical protein
MNKCIIEIPLPANQHKPETKHTELSLNYTFIDPSKMTPPNSFMEKLQYRMESYYSSVEPKQNDNK